MGNLLRQIWEILGMPFVSDIVLALAVALVRGIADIRSTNEDTEISAEDDDTDESH